MLKFETKTLDRIEPREGWGEARAPRVAGGGVGAAAAGQLYPLSLELELERIGIYLPTPHSGWGAGGERRQAQDNYTPCHSF